MKNNEGDQLNSTWTALLRDLQCFEDLDDHLNMLRRRWVIGASDWLAGNNNSKQNQKELLGYSDDEWEYIWATMMEDGAWAVPSLKDTSGNWLKDNCAPEMMIQYIAHDLRCHIVVFDLPLNTVQFCSANHLKDDNVVFNSPLLIYSTGSHFQSVFPKSHEFFIQYADNLEEENTGPNVSKHIPNKKEESIKDATHSDSHKSIPILPMSSSSNISNVEIKESFNKVKSISPSQRKKGKKIVEECSGNIPVGMSKPTTTEKKSEFDRKKMFYNSTSSISTSESKKIINSAKELDEDNKDSSNKLTDSNRGEKEKEEQSNFITVSKKNKLLANQSPAEDLSLKQQPASNKIKISNRYDYFSSEAENKESNTCTDGKCEISLHELKKIKNKTQLQKTLFDRLRKREARKRKTQEQKELDNQINQTRMSQKRNTRTQEEKKKENYKSQIRMSQKRNNQTQEEKERENVKDQTRERLKRKNQSHEEINIENIKDQRRMSQKRNNQTQEEKNIENIKDRSRKRQKRKNQTHEEINIENIKSQIRKSQKRNNQTKEEKNIEKIKDQTRKGQNRKKVKERKTAEERIQCFKQAVQFGPIFPCCCCEQLMFENGVSRFDGKLRKNIEEACSKNDKNLFKKVFGNKLNTKLDISKEYYLKINDKGPHFFVCHTCKIKLAKGRIPSMAAVNGLSLIEIPASKDINLTDLENNLVAQKILFQKIFQLPKSRIAAVKDKLVNIPIQESDIVNTLLSLPRTPMEGGLIEVRLKRKQIYKNYHRQEFINPEKLFRAIKFLKDSGNPFYQSFKNLSDYKKMCESEDPSGFQLLFGEEIKTQEVNSFPIKTRRCSVLFVDDNDQNWEEIMELKDYTNMMERELDEKEEIDYREKDSIRKYQIDYDESICLAENFPEAFYLENKKDLVEIDQISVAPGEGKVPENLLSSENWDALAFPMKHPDGRNNLHHKRDVKLSDQYYFVQRLRNKDERFRSDPSYLFAASSYIEKKQLQRNINVSFLRGKKSKSATQEGNVYNLEDAFSVFDSTSNTPTYWKKAKYEMMAKLDNLGPFQFFFTLSCADKLWEENSQLYWKRGISR